MVGLAVEKETLDINCNLVTRIYPEILTIWAPEAFQSLLLVTATKCFF